MCGWPYLDTMHVDRANLIMRYLSIRWSDLETGHIAVIVRTSRSFLWYAMNELMHVMQRQINACNAIMILGLGYVDGHSSYSPWLNHRCKIECLQYPYLRLSMHEREMREKEIEQTHQTSNHFPATTHKTQNPLQPPIHANLLNPTNYHIHHCQPQLRWWEREREREKKMIK